MKRSEGIVGSLALGNLFGAEPTPIFLSFPPDSFKVFFYELMRVVFDFI